MVATIIKIKRLAYRKVSYYTIQIDGKEPEFEDFQNRMVKKEEYKGQLVDIFQFIKQIGEKHGAHEYHFKHERAAHRLPPPYYYIQSAPNEYGVRLYCIRLSNSVVILLNGDVKTDRDPEQCKNCKKHFQLANKIAKKIERAIIDREIVVGDREIEIIDEDFVLYL